MRNVSTSAAKVEVDLFEELGTGIAGATGVGVIVVIDKPKASSRRDEVMVDMAWPTVVKN